jgi:hypothetical protein
MNKHFLLSLFFVCLHFASNAQGCPGGPITLATQAQVDAFPVSYPDCEVPNGRFVIGADPTVAPPHPESDITSLAPLSILTGFGNHTYIYNNPLLTSLNGLHNVTEVMGDFTIQKNEGLTDLTGLGSLTLVQDLLKIENNNNLQSLSGFAGGFSNLEALVIIENDDLTDLSDVLDDLATVDEYVYIQDNGSLPTLGTMNNLTSIGQYLNFEDHPSLTSIDAFNSLQTVGLQGPGWDFEILDCPILATLDDFSALAEVGKNFEVNSNNNLTTVSFPLLSDVDENFELISNNDLASISFPALTAIGGSMTFTNNDGLTSLVTGLTSNFTIGGTLTITSNNLLAQCEADAVCDHLTANNPATITDNAVGGDCESVTDVENACEAAPVELIFFRGKFENEEVVLTWQTASEENNDYFQVEHSTDGSVFAPLAKVEGRGTAASLNNYSFRHAQPAKGKNYYRLRQVDFDGAFAHSKIVQVEIEYGIRVEIYPNPTTSLVSLKGELSEGAARLLDVNGRLLIEKQLPNGRSFDLSPYPTGVYFIEIQMGSETIMKKVAKH